MLFPDIKTWFLLGRVPWEHFKNPYWKSQVKHMHMLYELNLKTGVLLPKIYFYSFIHCSFLCFFSWSLSSFFNLLWTDNKEIKKINKLLFGARNNRFFKEGYFKTEVWIKKKKRKQEVGEYLQNYKILSLEGLMDSFDITKEASYNFLGVLKRFYS